MSPIKARIINVIAIAGYKSGLFLDETSFQFHTIDTSQAMIAIEDMTRKLETIFPLYAFPKFLSTQN